VTWLDQALWRALDKGTISDGEDDGDWWKFGAKKKRTLTQQWRVPRCS